MIEVEVFGASLAPEAPSAEEISRLCSRVAASRGIHEAHVAIEFVDVAQIVRLNREHRGKSAATDVLSFPIDGVEPIAGDPTPAPSSADDRSAAERRRGAGAGEPTRELGDVIICPQHTADMREAIVHGMLHLLGMDHEHDHGEMLTLQRELLAGAHE